MVSKFNNLKVYLISNLRKTFQCHIKSLQWEPNLTLEFTISIVVKHFLCRDLHVNASSTFKLGNKMYFQWWKATLSWTMNQNMEWMQKCSNTFKVWETKPYPNWALFKPLERSWIIIYKNGVAFPKYIYVR